MKESNIGIRRPAEIEPDRKMPFTIIELLLVIAVLGLLTSLLVTPLYRTKVLARQTLCANNLRQIGAAVQLYKNDREALPAPFNFLDDFRPVYPYIHSLDVFVCPGNPNSVKKVSDFEALLGKTDYLYFSGKFEIQDVEKNGKKNNGHGNNINPYDLKLDPSNPSFEKKFGRLLAEKIDYPALYDRNGPAHFQSINLCNLENGEVRVESRPDMCNLWTLDGNGKLFQDSVTLFPPLKK